MQFDITYNGRTLAATTRDDALAKGFPAAEIGRAIKARATSNVAREAERYRALLATTSAGKLAAYRVKEGIAGDPGAASANELALIDREAAARGADRAGLLVLISAKATAYRQLALLVEVIEAEANAAITAIPDDAADIEAQIGAALAAARQEAEGEFLAAQAMLAG